jgi:hypothetical protein
LGPRRHDGRGALGSGVQGVVAYAAADQSEQMRWRRTAAHFFHFSLAMFLLGFVAIGLSILV